VQTRVQGANESESLPSVTYSVGNGGSTPGSPPTSDHGSVDSFGSSTATAGVNREGTTPVAAAPPEAMLGLGAASIMPRTEAVAPKPQPRHGKSATAMENCSGIDTDSPESSMGRITKLLKPT
jgi:GATA-binding protein